MKTNNTISHEEYQKIHQDWLHGLKIKRQNERFYDRLKNWRNPYMRIISVGGMQ